MNILAPIDNVNQINLFKHVGASEFYCGYIPYDWFDKYNKSIEKWTKKDLQLSLNRREVGFANITFFETFEKVVTETHDCGTKIYVTVNAPSYPAVNYPFISEYIKLIDSLGIDGIIISDVGLIKNIYKNVKCKLILSTCNQVATHDGVKFMQQLGIKRIVFPRHISLKQMEKITNSITDMEYECFVLEGKCIYDDGNCNILHSCGSFCSERWYTKYYSSNDEIVNQSELFENEEDYYEHSMPYLNTKLPASGWRNMGCGICSLEYILNNVNITSLKIAGRGLDNRQKLKNISILKNAIDLTYKGATKKELKEYMQQYQPWKELCNNHYRCYFPDFNE